MLLKNSKESICIYFRSLTVLSLIQGVFGFTEYPPVYVDTGTITESIEFSISKKDYFTALRCPTIILTLTTTAATS